MISFPSGVMRTGSIPKNGFIAIPGFWSHPLVGSGVIMIDPVSVCHHVSTIGQRPSPTTEWYQRHAFEWESSRGQQQVVRLWKVK